MREDSLKLAVIVAIERHARTEILWHTEREEAIAHHTIDTESLQLVVVIDETESVAIGEACHRRDIEGDVASYLLHLAHILSHRLRCVEGSDVGLATLEEVVGIATIESLLQIWHEGVIDMTSGGTAILLRIHRYQLIQRLIVGSHHILHIVDVLQSALYLEGRGTGVSQLLEMSNLTEVLEREQVSLVLYLLVVGVEEVELHTAELGALTTVG